jgi:hypothetical protein
LYWLYSVKCPNITSSAERSAYDVRIAPAYFDAEGAYRGRGQRGRNTRGVSAQRSQIVRMKGKNDRKRAQDPTVTCFFVRFYASNDIFMSRPSLGMQKVGPDRPATEEKRVGPSGCQSDRRRQQRCASWQEPSGQGTRGCRQKMGLETTRKRTAQRLEAGNGTVHRVEVPRNTCAFNRRLSTSTVLNWLRCLRRLDVR